MSEDLPTDFQREVGARWMANYWPVAREDPAFGAAAIYRMMRLALTDPECREVKFIMSLPADSVAEQVEARIRAAELRGFEAAARHLFKHGSQGCICQAHLESELARRRVGQEKRDAD